MHKMPARIGLLALLLLVACAQENTATPDEAWVAYYGERNLEALLALYADDAIVQKDGRLLSGKGQIAAHLSPQFSGAAVISQFSVNERIYDRDRIVINAFFTFFYPRPDGVERGTLVQVWVTNGVDWFVKEERWTRVETVQ